MSEQIAVLTIPGASANFLCYIWSKEFGHQGLVEYDKQKNEYKVKDKKRVHIGHLQEDFAHRTFTNCDFFTIEVRYQYLEFCTWLMYIKRRLSKKLGMHPDPKFVQFRQYAPMMNDKIVDRDMFFRYNQWVSKNYQLLESDTPAMMGFYAFCQWYDLKWSKPLLQKYIRHDYNKIMIEQENFKRDNEAITGVVRQSVTLQYHQLFFNYQERTGTYFDKYKDELLHYGRKNIDLVKSYRNTLNI